MSWGSRNNYHNKKMMQISRLKNLQSQPDSCITHVRRPVHLALQPSYLGTVNAGIFSFLNNKLNSYYPELKGVLMGYEKIRLKRKTGNILNDNPFIHVDIQADFYLFTPKPGSELRGRVNKKSSGHVGCLVHDTFNASIAPPPGQDLSEWCGKRAEIGKQITFTVRSVSYGEKMPFIQGRLSDAGLDVEQEDVEEAVMEVDEFEEPLVPDYDSGIDSIGSGMKKNTEEVEEDEEEKKRKRKEEKKKRKMMEGEVKSEEPVKKKKKANQKDEVETSLTVNSLEFTASKDVFSANDNDTSAENAHRKKLSDDGADKSTPKKTPSRSPKTPKEVFELPEGWTVTENKRMLNGKERSDKTYHSPAGKRFNSLVKVKKFVEEGGVFNDKKDEKTKQVSSNQDFVQQNSEAVNAMIDYVVNMWNRDFDGNLSADQPTFYSNPSLKDLPKEFFEAELPPKAKKVATPKSKAKPQTPVQGDLTENSFMANISPIKKSHQIPPKIPEDQSTSGKMLQPSSVCVEDLGESVKKKKNKKKNEDHSTSEISIKQDNLTDLTSSQEETITSHREKKKKKKKHKDRKRPKKLITNK